MRACNRIFGIGLNRTGTSSLHKALGILGIKSWHDSSVLYERMELNRMIRVDPLRGFEEYKALLDHPIDWEYSLLDRTYPGSLFIFTERELAPWIRSKQWLSSKTGSKNTDDGLAKIYHEHYQKVMEYFKGREKDLLIMNICGGDGWGKLCPFLELEKPLIPFPWVGARA